MRMTFKMATNKNFLGKYHVRKDGSKYINIRKDADVPFDDKEDLKISKISGGLLVKPVG